uniref:Uncharacterized protein n=1 Tax=Arundo donax TaxID=35708 RepID=A0A0A9D5L5_ARUDO
MLQKVAEEESSLQNLVESLKVELEAIKHEHNHLSPEFETYMIKFRLPFENVLVCTKTKTVSPQDSPYFII